MPFFILFFETAVVRVLFKPLNEKYPAKNKTVNLQKQKCAWQRKEKEMSSCYTCILQKLDINIQIS